MRGKRKRGDVNEFGGRVADNLSQLYDELVFGRYIHGFYDEYTICDPKKRIIHKASVRDRIVHRLLYNALYHYFDSRFIFDSYSCRRGKGTHKARSRFRKFSSWVSKNYTNQCYVLKFDIKKCFASIDTGILKLILMNHIADGKLATLTKSILDSFTPGLPLGNLTSQLFVNIYLHELDMYVKNELGIKFYIRYADDVVIVSDSQQELDKMMVKIDDFLKDTLLLQAHKIEIKSIFTGVDVVGEVFFPQYQILRRSTMKRLIKKSFKKDY